MSDGDAPPESTQKAEAWARACRIAERPRRPSEWQQALADALEVAVRPDAVGVFLCTLGNMMLATSAMAPREHAELGERLVKEFLPRLHREGIDTPWLLFADDPDPEDLTATLLVQTELLAPAGFRGIAGIFVRTSDGMVAGFITVFTRAPSSVRRRELMPELENVRRAAEEALRDSLEIASAVGGRFPEISPDPLSEREVEIARLVSNGLSDLNIAKRLAITEGTVGRHLHNIYRKLGVASRVELANLLCMPN